MKPAQSILDRARPYDPSHDTDIRRLFARVREQQEREAALARAGIVTLPKKKVAK